MWDFAKLEGTQCYTIIHYFPSYLVTPKCLIANIIKPKIRVININTRLEPITFNSNTQIRLRQRPLMKTCSAPKIQVLINAFTTVKLSFRNEYKYVDNFASKYRTNKFTKVKNKLEFEHHRTSCLSTQLNIITFNGLF